MYKSNLIAENKILITTGNVMLYLTVVMLLYLTFTTAKVKIKLPSYFFPNFHGCYKKYYLAKILLHIETCRLLLSPLDFPLPNHNRNNCSDNFDNFFYGCVNDNNFGKWQESTTGFTLQQLAIWVGENLHQFTSGNDKVALLIQSATENILLW